MWEPGSLVTYTGGLEQWVADFKAAYASDNTLRATMVLDDGETTPLFLPAAGPLSTQIFQPFTYTLPSATGGNSPYQYFLGGLPAGFSFDSATRQFAGTAEDAALIGTARKLTYCVIDDDGTERQRSVLFAIIADLRPLFKVEVDWDGDGTFANSESDVTSRIRTLPACKRGRDFSSNFFGQSGAGVLTMQLWDEDHLYDRFNTNSSLHDLVIPGLSVRVSMLSEGSYQFEWGGLLDSVKPGNSPVGV